MRKHLLLNSALVVVIVVIAIVAYTNVGSSSASSATRETVTTAKRGIVLSSVTATGNIEATTNLSLSFQQSGKLVSVSVKSGEHVVTGQELARLDDTQQLATLTSAQTSFASAQAAYAAKVRGETAYDRNQDAANAAASAQSVTTAQSALTHAQQSATQNVTKYQQQIDQAQGSLTNAQNSETSAKSSLDNANASMRTMQSSYDPNASSSESADARVNRYKLDQVSCSAHSGTPGYKPSDGVTCSQITSLISFATSVETAQTAYTQAQTNTTTAQNALATAQTSQTSGTLQDQQAIQNAQHSLDSANAQYASTLASNAAKQQPAKPEDLAQARSTIATAQQQVTSAQQNEDQTILRAAADGTVASVSGTVGQYISGGGGGSASSTSASSSSASTSSSTSSTSSSGFIQLTDVGLLDVKVGFTETDAPKVRVGAAASITLDALPGKTFIGRVVSLDTNQTVANNVVTYYAKISIDNPDTSVKPGMTASVNVVLDKRENVVTLPTSAVPTSGTTATVTVRTATGKDESRSITIGLRGDNAVEITSGLAAGDKVVSRSSAASTGSGGLPTPGGGGPGGGLGGGLGGGPGGR